MYVVNKYCIHKCSRSIRYEKKYFDVLKDFFVFSLNVN